MQSRGRPIVQHGDLRVVYPGYSGSSLGARSHPNRAPSLWQQLEQKEQQHPHYISSWSAIPQEPCDPIFLSHRPLLTSDRNVFFFFFL